MPWMRNINYVPMANDPKPFADYAPPQRRVFHPLVQQAETMGLWVRWARDSRVRQNRGGRYWVTEPECITPLFASDDLEEIKAWLNARGAESEHV